MSKDDESGATIVILILTVFIAVLGYMNAKSKKQLNKKNELDAALVEK